MLLTPIDKKGLNEVDANALLSRAQSPAEELANSLTHGLGVVLALILGPALGVVAVASGDPSPIVSSAIYPTTLLLPLLSSTLYPAPPRPPAQGVFRRPHHAP